MTSKNKINNLVDSISILKVKQNLQLIALKEQLQATGESLKPMNIIRTTANDVMTLVKAESNILNKIFVFGVHKIFGKGNKVFGKSYFNRHVKY